MRRLCRVAYAVIALAPAGAQAAGRELTLVNRTGYQIDHVFVSPSNDPHWGDGMPAPKLDDGGRVSIALPNCPGGCQWDLRVEYHDGAKATWSSLDLRAVRQMSLFWNTQTKSTTAEAY